MAMNDISVSIAADKESFLAFKDSSLADSGDESGADFFTQLQDAHTTFEPIKKEINKSETDTLSAASADSPSVTNEKLKSDSDDEDIAQINLLSGSDILEQINSSHLMNTEVTKPSEKVKDTHLVNPAPKEIPLVNVDFNDQLPVDDYVAVPAKDLPLEDKVGKIITPQALLADNSKIDNTKIDLAKFDKVKPHDVNDINASLKTAKRSKNPLTLAVEEQLNITADAKDITADAKKITAENGSIISHKVPEEKAKFTLGTTNTAEIEKISSNTLVGSGVIKSDKVLRSLPLEQGGELNAHDESKLPIGDPKVSIETTKLPLSQTAVNSSQKRLEANESQASKTVTLSIKSEEATKAITFIAAQTSHTVNKPQKMSVKSDFENSADSTKLAEQPSRDGELTKALDQLQKEGLKNTTAEQSPAKVMQLFNHMTNTLNTTQTSAQSYYDSVDYEMGILDQQVMQNQQFQSTAQTKQVSIDPGMMQAINIVKSDAAKLLQERVSSMLSINNKEAEIRLDPPEMGSMQIRVRSDAEQAQINFVVQNQQAKEALEQTMPRLREMLAQQGLELGESTISYGQSGSENAEQNEPSSGEQLTKNELLNSADDEQKNSSEQTSERQTASSIDYYA